MYLTYLYAFLVNKSNVVVEEFDFAAVLCYGFLLLIIVIYANICTRTEYFLWVKGLLFVLVV